MEVFGDGNRRIGDQYCRCWNAQKWHDESGYVPHDAISLRIGREWPGADYPSGRDYRVGSADFGVWRGYM